MYRQFHRILEAFKITEKKEDIKEEFGKDAPKPSNKPLEKVTDQFAADEEAVEVRFFLKNLQFKSKFFFFKIQGVCQTMVRLTATPKTLQARC